MKKAFLKYKFIILALVIGLVLIAGIIVFKNNFNTLTLGNKEYTFIESGENLNKIVAKGKIESDNTEKIYVTVGNIVKEVNVKVGDEVKKGDIIAVLDTKDLENEIKQCEEEIRINKLNNETNLQRTKNTYNDMVKLADENYNWEIVSAKSTMESAKLDLDNKRNTYNNNKILFENNALSKKELDDSEIALKNAENTFNDSSINLENIKDSIQSKLNDAELAYKEAQIACEDKTKEIQLDEKKQKLSECIIKAPNDGLISSVNISVGQAASGTLFELESFDDIIAAVDVKETYIDKVQLGQIVSMNINSLENQKIQGQVVKIQKISNDDLNGQQYDSDDKSAEFEIRIKIDCIDDIKEQLKIGMKVKADIILDEENEIYEIPSESIITEDDQNFVLIAEKQEGKIYVIKKMLIEKGREEEVQTQIKVKDIGDGIIILNKPSNYTVGQNIKIKH